MFKAYYYVTKPGIIYGNALTAIAGFLLASKGHPHPTVGIMMLIGLSLVIASGCVCNNIFDRKIDEKMERTKNRALVTGEVPKTHAIIFAGVLLVLGITVLSRATNHYSLLAALTGWIVYVLLYTPLKHRTVYATLIGSIAGATPPVVGYAAAAHRFDAGALILFFMLVFWQMPHFYAIAIRRLLDYQNASIPVLPIAYGIRTTKIHMLIFILCFMVAAIMLKIFDYSGYFYAVTIMALSIYWLWLGIQGLKIIDNSAWAKKMFLFSLIVITSLCVIIPVDVLLR